MWKYFRASSIQDQRVVQVGKKALVTNNNNNNNRNDNNNNNINNNRNDDNNNNVPPLSGRPACRAGGEEGSRQQQ